MGNFAMILLDDAIRFAKRHGYAAAREGNRLVLHRQDSADTASLLLDIAREDEGIVRVGRLSLERIVLGEGGKTNVLH